MKLFDNIEQNNFTIPVLNNISNMSNSSVDQVAEQRSRPFRENMQHLLTANNINNNADL